MLKIGFGYSEIWYAAHYPDTCLSHLLIHFKDPLRTQTVEI